ncbi:MAG: hypothetical protein ACKO3V_09155, partial [Pirellula sp.]
SAEEAMQLAPVKAQIALANEIGTNEGYQRYLVDMRGIEAQQTIQVSVGTAQAEALQSADVKVIANTSGSATEGFTSAMQLFTPQGGTSVGGMLESLANTSQGKQLLDALKLLIASKKDLKKDDQ